MSQKSSLLQPANSVSQVLIPDTLEDAFSAIEPDQRASLIYGLAEGLAIELADAGDPFLEVRVLAVLFGELLCLCPPGSRRTTINDVIEQYIVANRHALSRLNDAMATDGNALLIDSLSDLYDLPIRISDIFGQCALFFFGQHRFSESDSTLVWTIARKILDQYGNSILALTDDQATGYLLFLEMCRRQRWLEFSEEIVGRLYHDLHKNFARCGAYSLKAENRFALLTELYQNSLTITQDLYNSPSDLTTVILSFSALGLLDEAVDFTLIQIDHTPLNYFVPDNFDRFGLVEGLEGANHTLTLGRDFWRCIDLRRSLYSEILPEFDAAASKLAWEDRFCSLAAALALRDRLPWHIVGRPA
jgi:hypothetical protein